MNPLFTDEAIHTTASAVAANSRRCLGPKLQSLYSQEDLRGMAIAHGFRIRANGYPRHEPEDFSGWLYGRMLSHIRNKLGVALKRQSKGYLSPRGGLQEDRDRDRQKSHGTPARPSERTEVDEDLVSELCNKLGPRESSVVRRLADGEFIDDIAEALGMTPFQVKQIAARVAREHNRG